MTIHDPVHARELARAHAKRMAAPAEAPRIRVSTIKDKRDPFRFSVNVRCSFGPNFTIRYFPAGHTYTWLSPCCGGEIRFDSTRQRHICIPCRLATFAPPNPGAWDHGAYRASLNHHLDALEAELIQVELHAALDEVADRAQNSVMAQGFKVNIIHLEPGKEPRWI